MEEILSSIRRIIADDDASKSAQREAEPKPAAKSVAPPPEPPSQAPAPAPVVAEVPAPSAPESAADQGADILDLTESMAALTPQVAASPAPNAGPGAMPQFRKIEGHSESDVSFDDAVEAASLQNSLEAFVGREAREAPGGGDEQRSRLLSRRTSAAVDSAFNSLAQTVLVQNARTLEDLVREMLRPMLKSWLDDNLPGLVERLVRAEIERVSRGRAD